MAQRRETLGSEGELQLARQTNVGRHQKPSTITFRMSSVMGGMATYDRPMTTRANQRCAGGKPKNVEIWHGKGIMGECGGCGTNVYWDTRLHQWTLG